MTTVKVKVKNGYDLPIEGKPQCEVVTLEKPSHVALLPEHIPFVKPRLLVKIGDSVKVGTPLFEDKRAPEIKFLAPGSGEIESIEFGPRRIIRQIVIKLDSREEYVEFEKLSEQDVENIGNKELVERIMNGGLWGLLRQLPFRDIADPGISDSGISNSGSTAPSIFVRMDNLEPFHPDPEIYLASKTDLFSFGIKVLNRLSDSIVIYTVSKNGSAIENAGKYLTHKVSGSYPADDPGVVLFHTKRSANENQSWYINGQDVLLLADLLKNGRYPVERTVCVAGSMANTRQHLHTRLGAPVSHISCGSVEDKTRIVAGGVLTGYSVEADSYLGFYETSLTMLPKGGEPEFFGFARPGIDRSGYLNTFLSVFNKNSLKMDCSMHGENRGCINCSTCARVCPVDILPQFTMKAILADEIEEAAAHGLLDCVECGLCTYVCPSKIELGDIIKTARKKYYKECM
jgi:Na+-transporting NADH:ubiquinone oxidoreductase subunit A